MEIIKKISSFITGKLAGLKFGNKLNPQPEPPKPVEKPFIGLKDGWWH